MELSSSGTGRPSVPDRYSLGDRFAIIVLSALAFSPFGWGLILKVGGNFYPEPILIAFGLYCLQSSGPVRRVVVGTLRSRAFLAGTCILTVLFVLGSAVQADVLAAYADFRTCMIMNFSCCTLLKKTASDQLRALNFMSRLCFNIAIFNVLGSLAVPVENSTVKVLYPIFTIVFCFFAVVLTRRSGEKIGFVTICACLVAYMAATSFFRAFYIVALLVCCLALARIIYGAFKVRAGLWDRAAGIAGILSITLVASQGATISNLVYNYMAGSESRYIQSIGKLNDLADTFAGRSTNDESTRALYYENMWENIGAFMLPSGFGQKAIEGKWGSAWSTNKLEGSTFSSKDGGLVFMFTHFGILISALFLVPTLLVVLRGFVPANGLKRRLHFLVLSFLVFFVFAISGAMFVQVAFAVSFGACVGLILSWGSTNRALALIPPRAWNQSASRS